jgi:hypothetical protein
MLLLFLISSFRLLTVQAVGETLGLIVGHDFFGLMRFLR